jgi:hypothetical protein
LFFASAKGLVKELLNFSLTVQAELWCPKPDAAVKNSDTLQRFSKNFKFLKEVKILSEFFQNKLAMLNANLCQRKAGHQSKRRRVVAKNSGCGQKTLCESKRVVWKKVL